MPEVPERPGVYLLKDERGRILYVGKAKALRSRLRSYFQKSADLDRRKTAMVRSVRDFEFTATGNELEAFVLEANLIKHHRPRYNVLLRDDKSYPYLKLTVNEYWPRLEVVRRLKKDGARYFGPYVPSGPMWTIVDFVRNAYHIRSCRHPLDRPMRPCIEHQIKRCVAPCSGEIDHAEYLRMVDEVRLLLEGKNRGLLEKLEQRMQELSTEMRYEEAAIFRDRIVAVQKISEFQKAVAPGLGDIDVIGLHRTEADAHFKILFIRNGIMIGSRNFTVHGAGGEGAPGLLQGFMMQFYAKEFIPPPDIIVSALPEDDDLLCAWLGQKRDGKVHIAAPSRGLKRQLVAMAEENAALIAEAEQGRERPRGLDAVVQLLGLSHEPHDAGAFDISNISGTDPVGAFVYWAGGEFKKGRFRQVRMDAVPGPDDYSMMREMIRRTAASLGALPDLVVIDGGKAHLDAALDVFRNELAPGGISSTVISVAKDPDRVFLPDGGVIPIDQGGAAALFLRRLRDEVHRFAISYHKKRRAQRVLESPLEKIAGVGRSRRLTLLRHFGSIDAIRAATVDEIAAVRGLNRKVAGAIKKSL